MLEYYRDKIKPLQILENCSKCKTTIGVVAYISIPCPWESPGGDVIKNFMLSVSSQSCSWRVGKPPDPQAKRVPLKSSSVFESQKMDLAGSCRGHNVVYNTIKLLSLRRVHAQNYPKD
ncbi:hypothetical protein H671_1g4332 [Cricetulus griseus]|nr:hypothetical protein H671_1g4332 [Cricetulus griseus]